MKNPTFTPTPTLEVVSWTITQKRLSIAVLLVALLAMILKYGQSQRQSRFIVQGYDIDIVITAIHDIGGTITHKLVTINAVGATLEPGQRKALLERYTVRVIYKDHSIQND
jgi:hypothetical protein